MRILVTVGIGAACAKAIAAGGHAVIVHGRSANRCAPTVDAIRGAGGVDVIPRHGVPTNQKQMGGVFS